MSRVEEVCRAPCGWTWDPELFTDLEGISTMLKEAIVIDGDPLEDKQKSLAYLTDLLGASAVCLR
jgi:hypothetical protein